MIMKIIFFGNGGDSTTTTCLFKGRMKHPDNEVIKACWGFIPNLIKYKNNKRTLSSFDKRNFVKKMYKAGLIDVYDEIKNEVEKERQEYNKIRKKIKELEDKLYQLKNN